MITLRKWLVTFGLWLAGLGGWTPTPPCALSHLPVDEEVELARQIVADVERRFSTAPGAFKAREARRVLLNLRPDAATKDLNLLIELALQ
jgi:hypothetical protein